MRSRTISQGRGARGGGSCGSVCLAPGVARHSRRARGASREAHAAEALHGHPRTGGAAPPSHTHGRRRGRRHDESDETIQWLAITVCYDSQDVASSPLGRAGLSLSLSLSLSHTHTHTHTLSLSLSLSLSASVCACIALLRVKVHWRKVGQMELQYQRQSRLRPLGLYTPPRGEGEPRFRGTTDPISDDARKALADFEAAMSEE